MRTHLKEGKPKWKEDQVKKYLSRLETHSQILSIAFLKSLHKSHLFHIAFSNLEYYFQQKLSFDIDAFFKRVVVEGRGGISIELNLLFNRLLLSLGFKSWIVSGRIKHGENWGPDYEHPLIIIDFNDQLWLADVGSTGLFLEPKILDKNIVQLDYNQYFKFTTDPDENLILNQSGDGNRFKEVYSFNLSPVGFIAFLEGFHHHLESIHLENNKLVFINREFGYVKLTDKMLTRLLKGVKEEYEIMHEDDFAVKLKEYFGIDYDQLFYQRFTK